MVYEMKQLPDGAGLVIAMMMGVLFWVCVAMVWIGWGVIAPTTTDAQRCGGVEYLASGECRE